jgi:hypothetical protein
LNLALALINLFLLVFVIKIMPGFNLIAYLSHTNIKNWESLPGIRFKMPSGYYLARYADSDKEYYRYTLINYHDDSIIIESYRNQFDAKIAGIFNQLFQYKIKNYYSYGLNGIESIYTAGNDTLLIYRHMAYDYRYSFIYLNEVLIKNKCLVIGFNDMHTNPATVFERLKEMLYDNKAIEFKLLEVDKPCLDEY